MWQGRVNAIYIAATGGAPMRALHQVRAVAGKGLEGDRYFTGDGFYSWCTGPLREVSLIEAEVLERLAHDHQVVVAPGETRRNIVTEGVPLGHLIGRTFRIGDVLLRGVEICEPCKHLVDVTGNKRLFAPLVHRGGLHAQILRDGLITVGDIVVPVVLTEQEASG